MIVTCPKCTAQYRLDVSVVMRRPKLKCADCGLRWVPDEEIDEDEAVAAVQEEVRAARNPPPAPDPEPESEPAVADLPPPPEPERLPWGKWLVAIVVGAAFTTASVGLWVGRIEPEALPGVGDLIAQVVPPPPQLDVAVTAQVTRLPDGGAILEATGTIANPGRVTVAVPPLRASLMSGGAVAREWTIPAPAGTIAPGNRLAFASTITDVPAGPITVQVRFARNGL